MGGDGPPGAPRIERALRDHGKRAYNLARRVTGNAHDAEDVFQELFLRIWKLGPGFDRLERPASWVYRVVLNLSLDLKERRRKFGSTGAAGEDGLMDARSPVAPGNGAAQGDLRAALRASVEGLPRAQREVFVLRNDEGLSYKEIASVLSCPEDRARANFYQAMQSLRRRLRAVRPDLE